MAEAPAGWYPDPEGSERERYWDGIQWAEFREVGPSPPPPTAAPGPAPMVVVEPRSNRGCLYAVLAVIAFAVVGCVGAVVLIANAAEDGVDDGRGEVTIEFTSPFDEEKGFVSIQVHFIDTAFDLADDAVMDRCEIADATVL